MGWGGVVGSGVYLCAALFLCRSSLFPWKKNTIPESVRNNIGKDVSYRVLNNSAFQINQTIDVFLAGFLVLGAVGAFNIGTALGSILLTILGIPLSNTFFPRLSEQKTWEKRWQVLKTPLLLIWAGSIPVSIIGIFFAAPLLQLVYQAPSEVLELAHPVFIWTIASLPMMCSIPLLARVFHASGDNRTPLVTTAISLLIATTIAIYGTFIIFEKTSILPLAWANFTASTLSFGFLFLFLIRRLHAEKV